MEKLQQRTIAQADSYEEVDCALELFDSMSELVYVVDIETYELLYMNTSGKEQFKLGALDGLKCHQAIQGRESPCDFCTTPYLTEDSYYNWELTNPITGRHYMLKDRLVTWQGRRARLEIAFDLTEKQSMLEAENVLVNCMKTLCLNSSFAEAVKQVLHMLGEFSRAEHTYAFETKDARILRAYEWNAPGVPSYVERLYAIDLNHPGWENILGNGAAIEIYSDFEANRATTAATDLKIYIMAVNSSSAYASYLRMVLKTLVGFMTTVLSAKQYQKQLEQLSFVDTLTGVFNRNAFTQDIKRNANLPAPPAGVVYLSVNSTKELNDLQGREYGDRVLIDTAQTLQAILISSKVYRVGGDEFVAVWMDADSESFKSGIQRILAWQDQPLSAKSAVGYSWTAHCTDLYGLVSSAEEWMYRRKKEFYRGKALQGRYRCYNDEVRKLADGSTLEQTFASERFHVYFQPKFSVASRQLIGAEALVRLMSNNGQLLSPDQFIPFLEETRLIERLDFYIFEYVCSKVSQWMKEGRQVVPVAVNFSRYTIQEPWFRDMLLKILGKYHISKEYMEIEITESAEGNGGAELLTLLEQLKRDGFIVSIDDFGVKYSNLSIFTNGDFSIVKIDKSLIADWKNPRTQEVLRVLCNMCQHTNIHLIAEGVEQEEQLAFLREIRCEGAQGFLFSRPLPLYDYERLYLGTATGDRCAALHRSE